MNRRGAITSYFEINTWKNFSFFCRAKIISNSDLVHYYWGRRISIGEICLERLLGVKIIFSFIGTDVLRVAKAKKWKRIRARYGMKLVHEVTAGAPWLSDELKELGITSKFLPAAMAKQQDRILPLPDKFTVLSYIPVDRPGFYGWDTILRLAWDMPDVNFEIVGNYGKDLEHPCNIHFHGWVDSIIPYIQKSNVLLRLTEHDGLARTVIEALSCERHVVRTYKFPFCQVHEDYESTKFKLLELKKNYAPNYGSAEYVKKNFSEDKIMNGWENLYISLFNISPVNKTVKN